MENRLQNDPNGPCFTGFLLIGSLFSSLLKLQIRRNLSPLSVFSLRFRKSDRLLAR